MKFFFISCLLFLLGQGVATGQVLPHRMRAGLSADMGGTTLSIGGQLHGSFRFTDDYQSFDDQHQYLNIGLGIGATLSSGLSVGRTVPHYLTYGVGNGRAMWEFGLAGVRWQKPILLTQDNPQTGQPDRYPQHVWRYTLLHLVGYRYTAYSGFMFGVNGPVPGMAFGWIF